MTAPADPFGTAASSTGIEWTDVNGEAIIIWPLAVEKDIPTVHGDSDAVRANVAVLTGERAGTTYNDILIFPRVLQSQTKSKVGEMLLHRLGQGEAKKGQSAPWILVDRKPGDLELGLAWLEKHPAKPVDPFA